MKIDTTKSTVNFTIKKLLILTVKGTFPEMKGEININENDMSLSKIDVRIPVSNVSTKNKKRDEHLLQKDFFDASAYPEISYLSTNIEKVNGTYWSEGQLTVMETTKMIKVPFEMNSGRLTGELSLNRMDFKLGKIPAFVASNNVNISFDCNLK